MPYNPAVRKQKQAEYVARNKERVYAMQKEWYAKNKERALAAMKAYYAERKDQIRDAQRSYYQQNSAAIRAQQDKWRSENPSYRDDAYQRNPAPVRAESSRRRAARLQRSMAWDEELTDLVTKEAHALAVLREKATGFKWHVDHIIPLRGKTVSGLHVWNNLQVIPGADNARKGNRVHT